MGVRASRDAIGNVTGRLWQPPDMRGMRALHTLGHPPPWRGSEDGYLVAYQLEGAGDFRYRGRDWQAGPGSLTILEPGTVFDAFRNHGRRSFLMFWITEDAYESLGWRKDRPPHFTSAAFAALPEESRLAKRLVSTFLTGDGDSPLGEDRPALLVSLLGSLMERYGEEQVSARPYIHPGARRVRDLIHDHHDGRLTLDDMARVAGMNKYHLLRSFKAQYGVPPHEYVVQLRLQRARAMLERGASIADTAFAVGFSDQSHLTRFFRRAHDLTPREFVHLVARVRS